MKRNFLMIFVLVIACMFPAFSASATTAKSGGPCTKAGLKVTVYDTKLPNRGKVYTCVKAKSGLKFISGFTTVKVKSLLTISQVWKGNSVSLSLLDAQGNSCETNAGQASECTGFYIGWRASFKDTDRTVKYEQGNTVTVLSGLKIGDIGAFQLMYQETPGANGSQPIVIKEFPFHYNY